MVSGRNRHATHPVNAMLNYAYAVLESQVRIAAVAQGLDPTIGYLHARRPGRVALVYDLMEPLRPQADRLVSDLVRSHTFSPTDFILETSGVCRLHPQIARQVAEANVRGEVIQEVTSQFANGWASSCPRCVQRAPIAAVVWGRYGSSRFTVASRRNPARQLPHVATGLERSASPHRARPRVHLLWGGSMLALTPTARDARIVPAGLPGPW